MTFFQESSEIGRVPENSYSETMGEQVVCLFRCTFSVGSIIHGVGSLNISCNDCYFSDVKSVSNPHKQEFLLSGYDVIAPKKALLVMGGNEPRKITCNFRGQPKVFSQ